MQSKINDLLNFCYDDTESIEFQLFLITVKCLMPYEDNIGCIFDVDRYNKEIELFEYYMNEEDEIINYRLQHKKPSDCNDELLEFKIIPIIISNTVWDNTIDELLKAVVFYTLNKNTLLDAILISSAIYELMENSSNEDIEELAKERLINFSVKDFFTNSQMAAEKNYIIDFERERIRLLSKPILFDEHTIDKYKALKYIFKRKDSFNKNRNGSVENKSDSDNSSDRSEVLNSFSEYLYKLRKGTINPEKLKISDKIPDIKECLRHPLFNHPLLGRCKVVQRTGSAVIIRNKTGTMRIRI